MKFVIDKNIILEGLSNVTKAIGTRTTIPILQGIKFELTKDGLNLLASDTELSIKIFIPEKDIKEIINEGTMIIQSKFILEIIRKMPSDIITFESIDTGKIRISTNANEFELNCYDVSDYPHINMEISKDPINIKANVLKEIINQTVFAVSTQEVRPILTGLNFKISDDLFECISTDSYRLAKKSIKLDNVYTNAINVVVPGKNISEFEKMLIDEENVEIYMFSNKVLFKYNNISFQSNLLSGTYPDTSNFIPKEFAYMININLKSFNDAVDRASLLAQSKDKNRVKLLINGNEMTVMSSSNELGKTEEKLNIECNNNEKLDIAFSSRYMLEALKVVKDDNILLLINSDDKPIIIKPLKDETFVELILPMKDY